MYDAPLLHITHRTSLSLYVPRSEVVASFSLFFFLLCTFVFLCNFFRLDLIRSFIIALQILPSTPTADQKFRNHDS
jgi:hypothetical protein